MTVDSTTERKTSGSTLPRLSESRLVLVATMLAAVTLLVSLLVINRALFQQPLIENSDYAANALQIQKAKHFGELLGNYSRWGFHHPGPAFFYVFAAGEAVLRDVLHIVPEAMNAHIITVMAVNTAFLFAAIAIFARYCKSLWFVPAATAAAILVIYMVNHTISSSALISVWPPHLLMFCFLLYATACASVSTGNISHLPVAVLSGLLLLHSHIAQTLFVAALAVLTPAVLIVRNRGLDGLRDRLRTNKRAMLVSAALVVLFALPPPLELFVHRPNNLHYVHVYWQAHHGFENDARTALLYELSFFTFLRDPETVVGDPKPHLFARAIAQLYVAKYWGLLIWLSGLSLGLKLSRKGGGSPFLRFILLEVAVVLAVFWYWGRMIAGGLFNFNGHFLYSIHLLILFALVSALLDLLNPKAPVVLVLLASLLVPLSVFAAKSYLSNEFTSIPGVEEIARQSIVPGKVIQLAFSHDDWMIAVGVASRLRREHQPFCVPAGHGFMFGYEYECRDLSNSVRLILTRKPVNCADDCRLLWQDLRITAVLVPQPRFNVPFALDTTNWTGVNENVYGPDLEGDFMWTRKKSCIQFLAASDFVGGGQVRMRVTGTPTPGRPAQIAVNGGVAGTIRAGDPHAVDFLVDTSSFRAGSQNEVCFLVPNAGPSGRDTREFGSQVEKVEFESAASH